MLATAADVPPELFDRVLSFFTWTAGVVMSPEQLAESKRTLSKCSLTCRFWASRCRPWIFERTTLRSPEDLHTLLSFPTTIRLYITDLFLEETEPCIPWTHNAYTCVRRQDFSPTARLYHNLNGACTATSVQVLRSLHQSLPKRIPNLIEGCFPLSIRNYRLQEFTDLVQLVRKLSHARWWNIEFSNVSWIKQPDILPPALSMKNRAMCDRLEIRECIERWPFVWLCLSTRQPTQNLRHPYLLADEAHTLTSLIRCITAPAGHKGRPSCTHTVFHRNDNIRRFKLYVHCAEAQNCTPRAWFAAENGRLSAIRLEFNTDPNAGCLPFDFDWSEFDMLAVQCTALTVVTMVVEENKDYASEFVERMSSHMKYLHESGKVEIQYYPGDSEGWQTWVSATDGEEEVPEQS